ncbi:hypothetical protein D9M71_676340 [compost metagenome]
MLADQANQHVVHGVELEWVEGQWAEFLGAHARLRVDGGHMALNQGMVRPEQRVCRGADQQGQISPLLRLIRKEMFAGIVQLEVHPAGTVEIKLGLLLQGDGHDVPLR